MTVPSEQRLKSKQNWKYQTSSNVATCNSIPDFFILYICVLLSSWINQSVFIHYRFHDICNVPSVSTWYY